MEKRIFERIDGSLNVRYSSISPENNKEFFTYGKNLSGGGIRVFLNGRFKKGDLISLRIFPSYRSGIEVRCFGRIAWIWNIPESIIATDDNKHPLDAGIEFMDQNLLQIGRLCSYLEKQKTWIY